MMILLSIWTEDALEAAMIVSPPRWLGRLLKSLAVKVEKGRWFETSIQDKGLNVKIFQPP